MIDAIGGYFGTEPAGEGIFPHQQGVLLNTGRNALEYILRSLSGIKCVYIPFYTCEVVFAPLRKLRIPYLQYHTNERFEIAEDIRLKDGEYIIVNNFFGIKDAYVADMATKYGEQLIVDCAQAFFAPVLPDTKMYFSARKFVGVADGGVAYPSRDTDWHLFTQDDSGGRQTHLGIRIKEGAEAGYREFQENEAKLGNQEIRLMSQSTRDALQHIDYASIVEKRNANYLVLHQALKDQNQLCLPDIDSFACPMVYPYLSNNSKEARKHLLTNRIYVAQYWPNVIETNEQFGLESAMANEIIPLPIDQRYGEKEMKKIIQLLQ